MPRVFQTGEQAMLRLPVPAPAPKRRLRVARIVVGYRTYAAYDAHAVLSLESDESLARPGHLV